MPQPSEVVGGVPVFRPSMDEFRDFYKYMQSINEHGMRSGIVKVVPPAEWVHKLPTPSREQLMSIKIRNPITQHISGQAGVFAQQNVEKARSYNIVQWKALSQEPQFQPPAPRGKPRLSIDSAMMKQHKHLLNAKSLKDPSLFDDFDYNIDTSEFTPERCEQLEKLYWKSLMYAEPMYGADMIGSIFDESVKEWNVAHLPNVLDYMEEKLPGVNDAYLYAGLWKATFSWHLEDQDLYSINYLHFGAPKQWYSISQEDKEKFDNIMRDTFPREYAYCPDFLRHKTFLVSPAYLEARGVRVNRIVHNEQEFMITYPFGYHAGMNFGYNVAESVNFALEEWFEYGLKTSRCMCINDSVGLNVEKLMRRFKGEPEPEPGQKISSPESTATTSPEYQRPSPETTVGTADSHVISSQSPDISEAGSKKRLLSVAKSHRRRCEIKKPKIEKETPDKIIKTVERAVKPGKQCELCPNTFSDLQLEFDAFKIIALSGEKNKVRYCHKLCAQMIPELSIEGNIGSEFLVGFDTIPNARKKLRCVYCHESKKGACFQCTHPTCTRSYHATCAIPAGVYFDGTNALCKVHRNNVREDHLGSSKKYLSSLVPGDLLQAKFSDYFAGVVVAQNPSEGTLIVDLYPLSKEKKPLEIPFGAVKNHGLTIRSQVGYNCSETESTDTVETVKVPDHIRLVVASAPATKVKERFKKPLSDKKRGIECLNLRDPRYTKSIQEFFDKTLVLETIDVTESVPTPRGQHSFWHYKPVFSSDLKARYVDDVTQDEPNDPDSLSSRGRKAVKRVYDREGIKKSEQSTGVTLPLAPHLVYSQSVQSSRRTVSMSPSPSDTPGISTASSSETFMTQATIPRGSYHLVSNLGVTIAPKSNTVQRNSSLSSSLPRMTPPSHFMHR